VGLLQRALDDAGLCTLSITQNLEITAIIMPSRALYVGHPFGLTFGAIGDRETQRQVLAAMLDAAVTMEHRGIRDSGFEWEQDDLRHRQLRKQGR
jgi:D-proline reductase (dithiol) PrdB